MKRLLCVLVTLMLVSGAYTTVYKGVCGEHLTWSYDTETAHMTIEGYGELKNTVDSLWWNKPVLQAASWSTSYNTYYPYNSCKTISLPAGLTKLPNGVFRYWWNLTACEIPEGVTKLPSYAFGECYALKEITLPNSIDTVEQYAFENCTTMVKCDLGKGVKYIGRMTFENCYKLTSVRWSDCLEVIDGRIFDGYGAPYTQQDVANIPIKDTLFFPATFRSGSAISYGYLNSPVIVWNAKNPPASSSVFNNPYNYFYGDFIFGPDVEFVPASLCTYVRVKNIVVPEGVKWIGASAFATNNQLLTISLPSTLTAIYQDAFKSCKSLKEIIMPEGIKAVYSSTFSGCAAMTKAYLPNGITTIGDNAFSGCAALDSIVLPAELTMIGGGAFSGIKLQDTLVIPDKVISIGTNAFENWSELKDLTIGKNVVLIGDNAFKGDSAITHITVWAATPPNVSAGTLADIPDTAWLSVLPDSRRLYLEHPYWGRFRMSETPEPEMIQRTVIVEPAETTADFTWPTDTEAHSYQIDIYKDGMVFCRLTLGARGQLLGISFSTQREQDRTLPYTLSFKVTGLDEASRYNYVLSVLDEDGKPIHVYIGDFATKGYPGTLKGGGDEVIPTPPIIPSDPEAGGLTTGSLLPTDNTPIKDGIYLINGKICIINDGKRYDMGGMEIKD